MPLSSGLSNETIILLGLLGSEDSLELSGSVCPLTHSSYTTVRTLDVAWLMLFRKYLFCGNYIYCMQNMKSLLMVIQVIHTATTVLSYSNMYRILSSRFRAS